MKPFNLEAFKAGQKALTRSGQCATFVGICEKCMIDSRLIIYIEKNRVTSSVCLSGKYYGNGIESPFDLVSMGRVK